MGTRHLVCVQIDGEYKVAQYGQWDGYPEGVGVEVLDFLHKIYKEDAIIRFSVCAYCGGRNELSDKSCARCGASLANSTFEFQSVNESKEIFLNHLRNSSFVDQEWLAARWKDYGADENGLIDMDNANRFKARYPEFSRDTSAGILDMIFNNDNMKLQSDIEFASESLFCEYVYVIDFDKDTFEVFLGYNKEPLSEGERFFDFEVCDYHSGSYYPVRWVAEFNLNCLPTEKMFLDVCHLQIDKEQSEE